MTDNIRRVQRRMPKEMLWVGIVTVLLCLTTGLCRSFPWSGVSEAYTAQSVARNPQRAMHTVQPGIPQDSFSVPLLYELYWIGSISMVVLLIFYFFYLYKKEKLWLVKPLTFLLLFLALSLYLMEQGQTFTGHFDPARHLFVPGYHEANDIGFLRFIYKLTLGIALCVYGFTNFLARQKNKKSMNSEAEPDSVVRD